MFHVRFNVLKYRAKTTVCCVYNPSQPWGKREIAEVSGVMAVLTASLSSKPYFVSIVDFQAFCVHVMVLRVPLTAFTVVLNGSKERSGAPLAQVMLLAEGEN